MKVATVSRVTAFAAVLVVAGLLAHCGGSSSHPNTIVPPGSNVQAISVNGGVVGNYANGVFTNVTVCVPSSTTCQTISDVLVDTGSYGLRLLSSTSGGALTLSLPTQAGPIGQCALFVDGYTWGPVATADIKLASETASGVPVQIIDSTFSTVPTACNSAGGGVEMDDLQSLGANGILGVGPFLQDCGGACTQTGSSNPGLYYNCAATPCTVTAQALAQQVSNPVGFFATDNNGVVVELPAVTAATASISGSLVFGIGTQSNNGLSGATVFPLDSNGEFTTSFHNTSYPGFIDSGSNGIFFLDSSTTSIPTCSDNTAFYCPNSAASLSATTVSGGTTETVNFAVQNADNLFSISGANVFPGLAGPNTGIFDWGLPFFFGRNVFTAIESASTPGGTGPYWAF